MLSYVDAVRMAGGVVNCLRHEQKPEPVPALSQSPFHPTLGGCEKMGMCALVSVAGGKVQGLPLLCQERNWGLENKRGSHPWACTP